MKWFYHVSSSEWVDIQDDSLGNETNFLLWKYRNFFFYRKINEN
jgi:hypothetical protein